MEMKSHNQKVQSLSSNKLLFALILFLVLAARPAQSQCLSAANPVGGSSNLLVLEQNTLRIISFYRHNYGNQYFEGDKLSDYNLIKSAGYNYFGTILGYGLTNKITVETELGYFIDKIQVYNGIPEYSLRGNGLSNVVVSLKGSLLKNNDKRFFISSSAGAKIPPSREPQIRNGVVLPVEVQPTLGAYGAVFQLFIVKEYPANGIRYFLTGRMETNARNNQDYKQGSAVYTSLFFSKHLMFPWLKGDWTAILQARNEIRGKDKTVIGWKESSGGSIYYLSPQLNTFVRKKWNLSIVFDVPVYQRFNGTQLATKYGISFNFARDFML
jgi:hypothetical protein